MSSEDYLEGLIALGILSDSDLPHPWDNNKDYQEFVKNGNCEDKDWRTYLALVAELEYWVGLMDNPDFSGPNYWHHDIAQKWDRISREVSYLEYELGY